MRASRWLVLAVLAVLVLAVSCSGGDDVTSSNKGNVRIELGSASTAAAASTTDSGIATSTGGPGVALGPSDDDDDDDDDGDHEGDDAIRRLQSLNVTFSSFTARNLDGQLIDVTIDLPVTIDLLSLDNGKTATLPIGFLPPGTYDQFVVVMTEVELVLLDETSIRITPPGGGWTAVIPTCLFEVIDGETTTVKIKFRPRKSLRWHTGNFLFQPQFDCDEM